jgi:hypothetical protein
MRAFAALCLCALTACFGPERVSASDHKQKLRECAQRDDFDTAASDKAFSKLETAGCKEGYLADCERWFKFVVAACSYDHDKGEKLVIHVSMSPSSPSSYVDERNTICDKARANISRTSIIELEDPKGRTVTICGGRKKQS